jgi:hypothetical protein
MTTVQEAEALALDYLSRFVMALEIDVDVCLPEDRAEAQQFIRGVKAEIERILQQAREDMPTEWRARRLSDTLCALKMQISLRDLDRYAIAPTSDQAHELQLKCDELAGPPWRGYVH